MKRNRKELWRRVRAVIRAYGDGTPSRTPEENREREAVRKALEETERKPDGAWRVRLVTLHLIRRTHTLDGAALACHVSRSGAVRWIGEFTLTVAKNLNWI